MKLYRLIWIVVLIGIQFSCWKKQNNPINPPETPVYKLTGRVVNSYTGEKVSSAIVTISGVVKYTNVDSTQGINLSSLTNSDGLFEISDVPGGYNYSLLIQKVGFSDYSANVVVQYQDRTFDDIQLGLLIDKQAEYDFEQISITGIAAYANRCCVVDSVSKQLITFNLGFQTIDIATFSGVTPQGLCTDSNIFYTYNILKDSIEAFHLTNDTLIERIQQILPPQNPYHPDESLKFTDFDVYQGNFWCISEPLLSRYYSYEPTTTELVSLIDNPLYNGSLFGIAVEADTLYLGVMKGNENRIYELQLPALELKGYRVFEGLPGRIAVSGNRMFIAAEHNISQYLIN
ncbi:hypothetical protein JW960_25320 [candidate division KSB1 bacterium]|nr:hypothetical protein [candidate division KSB1 bacterium]